MMSLRLFVGRSRCAQYAVNSISTVKPCSCNQITRSSRTVTLIRGFRTGNAGQRCQHVCGSVHFVRSQSPINSTFAFSYLRYCRLRAHFYHTSPVSLLANKYDGSKSDEADAVVPPPSGKLNYTVDSEDQDSDPEIASILQDMNEDFRAGLSVNEIDLEEPTDSHSESNIFIDSEQQGEQDEEEPLSTDMSTEESEPIDIDKELLKYDYEEFDVYFEPTEEEPEEPKYPISLERMYAIYYN